MLILQAHQSANSLTDQLFIFGQLLHSYLPLVISILPLLAAVLMALGARWQLAGWLGTGLLTLTMLLGWRLAVLAWQGVTWQHAFVWLRIPDSAWTQGLHLGIRVDFEGAMMVCLTTTINWLVHGYALAYLKTARWRYGALTSVFVSMMLCFWMADNLLGRFIGWELIGWGSYLLIGFWYHEADATRRSTKAWLINQAGSLSLLVGLLLLGSELGTWNLVALAQIPPSALDHHAWLGVARFCLVAGLCAKSAQWPWFSWLSSAMKAPTPASALIHSATLVGAGVYWLAGLAPVLGPTMLTALACVGALTAFMGAYAALTQQHAKQVLAYSTISQLGYTVMAVGVGASHWGLRHFVVHAFAKACLFLCVGVVSQFVGTGSMQAMGGLRKRFPIVWTVYLLAACSLLGVPGFAGALSKEAIGAHVWAWAHTQALGGYYGAYLVPMLAWSASVLAVVYLGRQGYLIFMGGAQWRPETVPAYRTPHLMHGSIALLAVGTLACWYSPWIGVGSPWPLTGVAAWGLWWAALLALLLGGGLCIAWQRQAFSAWPTTWTQPSLRGWYLDAWMEALAQQGWRLSQRVARMEQLLTSTVQALSRGYVAWGHAAFRTEQLLGGGIQALSQNYRTLGHAMHGLDRQLAGLIMRIVSAPRYLGQAHRTTQQGSWQQALGWILVGVGLLLGVIYYLGVASGF